MIEARVAGLTGLGFDASARRYPRPEGEHQGGVRCGMDHGRQGSEHLEELNMPEA